MKTRPAAAERYWLGPIAGPAQPLLAAVVVVGLAAAGLGQPAGDHVADGQQGDVPPGLVGPEVVEALAVLAGLDQERGQQDAGEHDHVGDELGGLVGGLGLGAEPAGVGPPIGADRGAAGPAGAATVIAAAAAAVLVGIDVLPVKQAGLGLAAGLVLDLVLLRVLLVPA